MRNYKNTIELLNQLGYNIVEIHESFYAYNTFEGYSQHTHFSTIKGRDVSDIISDPQLLQISGTAKQQQDGISTKIESLPIIRKQFSNNIPYILHLS